MRRNPPEVLTQRRCRAPKIRQGKVMRSQKWRKSLDGEIREKEMDLPPVCKGAF